jgi:hypothetical protein
MSLDEYNGVPGTEHISVVGEATCDVVPDLIVSTFSLDRVAETMALAKQDIDDRCSRVIQFARETGIVNADITASQLTLAPHREVRNGEWHEKGYRAQRNVTLKLRNLSNFNQLIAGLVMIPIDRIVKIDRQVLDRAAAEQVAFGKAVLDGKSKAEFLASQLGVSLGRVYSVRIRPQEKPRG